MRREDICERLKAVADEKYRDFSAGLLPTISKDRILGVRLPVLRKIAAEISKDDWKDYLENAVGDCLEEVMLQGMVIGCVKEAPEVMLPYVEAFLPRIDCWSVCDSFCSGLKCTRKDPKRMWRFVLECLNSEETYTLRFAVVMMLQYYVDDEYQQEALKRLEQIETEEYYVRMAVAWALSVYYVRYPKKVLAILQRDRLDQDTKKKTLQKIVESRRVSDAEKARIRSMRTTL